MVWVMSNGIFANLPNANWFIKGLSDISPSRFNCEGFFRRMITEIPNTYPTEVCTTLDLCISQDDILKTYGFTYGDEKCIIALCIWTAVMLLLGVMTINYKFRRF